MNLEISKYLFFSAIRQAIFVPVFCSESSLLGSLKQVLLPEQNFLRHQNCYLNPSYFRVSEEALTPCPLYRSEGFVPFFLNFY